MARYKTRTSLWKTIEADLPPMCFVIPRLLTVRRQRMAYSHHHSVPTPQDSAHELALGMRQGWRRLRQRNQVTCSLTWLSLCAEQTASTLNVSKTLRGVEGDAIEVARLSS